MSADNYRIDLRRMRATSITAIMLRIVEKHIIRDGADRMREIARDLEKTLCEAGAEIVTDATREEIGLSPRSLDGWTTQELIALEQRRLEALTKPYVQTIVVSKENF